MTAADTGSKRTRRHAYGARNPWAAIHPSCEQTRHPSPLRSASPTRSVECLTCTNTSCCNPFAIPSSKHPTWLNHLALEPFVVLLCVGSPSLTTLPGWAHQHHHQDIVLFDTWLSMTPNAFPSHLCRSHTEAPLLLGNHADRAVLTHLQDKLLTTANQAAVRHVMRSYDTDHTGRISCQDLTAALQRLHVGLSPSEEQQ
ncbi:hypothetical protein HaLaN_30874, partial [Haematococcus lacustris]